jgi:hypothetical protein
VFTGDRAVFDSAVFTGHADFADVQFETAVAFSSTTFHAVASFAGAVFHYRPDLWHRVFRGDDVFGRDGWLALFYFNAATFHGYATFNDAVFHTPVSFNRARFVEDPDVRGATFHRHVSFRGAVFETATWLSGMTCHGGLDMTDATLRHRVAGLFPTPPAGWEITPLPGTDTGHFTPVANEDDPAPT